MVKGVDKKGEWDQASIQSIVAAISQARGYMLPRD